MKLKALVISTERMESSAIVQTDFPVFPVENITEEALAVWKLHAEEVQIICADSTAGSGGSPCAYGGGLTARSGISGSRVMRGAWMVN